MKLYHGTSSRFLDKIKREGIKPRAARKGNWGHTVHSNPRAVYLTNAYSLYYAFSATNARKIEPGLILEIDSNKLNPFLFSPDEDFLQQATRSSEDWAPVHALDKKEEWGSTKWFRDNLEKRWMGTEAWEQSVEHMGNCCYFGTIPRKAITRYAVVNDIVSWIMWSDPTISIMNFRFMGEYYKALSAKVFGDDVKWEGINGHYQMPPAEQLAKVEVYDMEEQLDKTG